MVQSQKQFVEPFIRDRADSPGWRLETAAHYCQVTSQNPGHLFSQINSIGWKRDPEFLRNVTQIPNVQDIFKARPKFF